MKEKITIALVSTIFIGVVYFFSHSNESSKSEAVVIGEITPLQIEEQPMDFINEGASETEILCIGKNGYGFALLLRSIWLFSPMPGLR